MEISREDLEKIHQALEASITLTSIGDEEIDRVMALEDEAYRRVCTVLGVTPVETSSAATSQPALS